MITIGLLESPSLRAVGGATAVLFFQFRTGDAPVHRPVVLLDPRRRVVFITAAIAASMNFDPSHQLMGELVDGAAPEAATDTRDNLVAGGVWRRIDDRAGGE